MKYLQKKSYFLITLFIIFFGLTLFFSFGTPAQKISSEENTFATITFKNTTVFAEVVDTNAK